MRFCSVARLLTFRVVRVIDVLGLGAGIALTILTVVTPISASIDLFNIDEQPVVLTASEQNREEVWNWFPATSPKFDNRYNFLGSWIRVGAGYELDGVKGFAEL